MTVPVCRATDSDTEAIAALNQIVQQLHADEVPWMFKTEGLTPQAFTSIMKHKDTLMFVAESGGETAGYLFAQLRHHNETGAKADVFDG